MSQRWFSVSRAEQRTRFLIHQVDPVLQWELSAHDIKSLDYWDACTEAKVAMFRETDTECAPWMVVKSNDKKRARIEAMRSLLARIAYDDKDLDVIGTPDPPVVGAAATLREEGEDEASLSPTPIAPGTLESWARTASRRHIRTPRTRRTCCGPRGRRRRSARRARRSA
nr:hypothetical protein [Kibdelosporangium phytohabitans]